MGSSLKRVVYGDYSGELASFLGEYTDDGAGLVQPTTTFTARRARLNARWCPGPAQGRGRPSDD